MTCGTSCGKKCCGRIRMIFQTVERQRPNRYVEYRIGKMYAGGLGTQRDESARYFHAPRAFLRYSFPRLL